MTAVTMTPSGHYVVVGFAEGSIELIPTDSSQPKQLYAFEQVPSSPPVRILAGPMDTLIVGYANGLLGIWNQSDGKRLAHAQLHGPVVHLLLEKGKLYAATELGSHLVWDLSAFHRDYCELVREVWQQVPVIWYEGHPTQRPPPADHRCNPAKRAP